MSSTHSHTRAIVYALIGYTCWVMGDMFMKLAAEIHVPIYQVMTFGGLGGMASILLVTAIRGKLNKLRPHKMMGLMALGTMFVINYVLCLIALPHMPLVNYYTIIFMAPILVAVMATVFLKEHLSWQMATATIIGFIGVLIAINPKQLFDNRADWATYITVFIIMIVFALQMITLRMLGHHESRESMAFYPRVAPILAGIACILIWGFKPMTTPGIVYSFSTGIIGGIGWLLMAQAYKSAPAATVAPFHYSEIITGAIFGYFIWHDIPTFQLAIGAAIIIASGIYVVTHARKSSELAKALKENP